MQDISTDIRDIGYFVDHVVNLNLRVSLIESLGYKIGVDVVSNDAKVKTVRVGKKGDTRVQITPCYKGTCLAKCAIIDSKEKI